MHLVRLLRTVPDTTPGIEHGGLEPAHVPEHGFIQKISRVGGSEGVKGNRLTSPLRHRVVQAQPTTATQRQMPAASATGSLSPEGIRIRFDPAVAYRW